MNRNNTTRDYDFIWNQTRAQPQAEGRISSGNVISISDKLKKETPWQKENEDKVILEPSAYLKLELDLASRIIQGLESGLEIASWLEDESRKSKMANTSSRKDENAMDWQEKYFDKLDRDISDMKNSLQATEDRIARMIENAMNEIRDRENQRQAEMRDRDNQRHQEMMEIRTSLDNLQKQIHEERKWVMGTNIAAISGIAAIVVAVLIAIWQILSEKP